MADPRNREFVNDPQNGQATRIKKGVTDEAFGNVIVAIQKFGLYLNRI
jgi:hypothetical protein